MRRLHRHTTLALIAALVAAFVSFATAQVDERSRALLEGLRPPAGEVIETLDQTMVMTLELEGGMEVRTRTVIDYVTERALIEAEVMPGMSVTIVVVDGQMSMRMGGMSLPMPPGMGEEFADVFAGDPNDPLAEVTSATFDGPVSYGNVVSGDQVSVRGMTQVAGADSAEDARFVFDAQGRLLAVVSESDEGVFLAVFDEPVTGSPAVGSSATMYLLSGDEVERFATMRFESIRINEPIDESLF